jgi:aminoglycoside phosphotransferase (APT) family kinase protein
MQPLAHGYTNNTVGNDSVVVKTYTGPLPGDRRAREIAALQALQGRFPVPPIIATDAGSLTMGFVAGAHGQDLIDAGHAEEVLRSCGAILKRLHDLDLIHGDFGPNNILFDPKTFDVTAVLDWEWARTGDPIVDLAWCEWIVRMHHQSAVPALAKFFEAYGRTPPWPERQRAMVDQCRQLLDFCRQWNSSAVALWEERVRTTEEFRAG